jgi:hypothetical protein
MAQGGGQGELIGLVHLDYRGTRHVLGRTADAYAIWDAAGGPPRQTFPLSDDGWIQAWQEYQRLEASASWTAPPAGPTGPGGVAPGGGPGAPGGMAPGAAAYALDYPGGRYGLGRAQGQYVIWDLQTQAGVRAFPLTDEGWAEAWRTFRELDEPFTIVPTAYWQKGRPIPIRAMRAGQIIGGAFKLYFMHFWKLILLSASVLIPLYAITSTLVVTTFQEVTTEGPFGATATFQNPPWVTVVNSVIQLLGTAFLTATVLAVIADAFLGRQVTLGRAYRVGFRRAVSVLWVSFLTALAVVVFFIPAFVVLFILAAQGALVPFTSEAGPLFALYFLLLLAATPAAIFLAIRLLFATSAVMVEGQRGIGALRRSWALVRGQWWRTFGIFLLGLLILLGLGVALGLIFGVIIGVTLAGDATFGFTPGQLEGFIIGSLIFSVVLAVLATPFINSIIALLYFDSRVRKEGFSEQVLAREWEAQAPSGITAGAAPPPAGPAPPPGP